MPAKWVAIIALVLGLVLIITAFFTWNLAQQLAGALLVACALAWFFPKDHTL